jgi:hypothetical protein
MNKLLATIFSFLAIVIFTGCLKDQCSNTYAIYTPVYKTLSQVHSEIKSTQPQPLQNIGKIYLYGNYIFLNEINKGIHAIDNSIPSSPKNISFISVPGNMDITVKGNYLYADSYSDLVVFNISTPTNAVAERFINKIFPDRMVYATTSNPDSIRVITGYDKRDTTVSCDTYQRWTSCPNCMTLSSGASFYAAPPSGIGGSMARFAVVNNYLYGVSTSQLKTFDIADAADPKLSSNKNIGWNIETIYPFKNKLFIGSSDGMFIFNINNPAAPVQEGRAGHMRACDPVVADDNTAYVTLRSGTWCQGFNNQLDVLNVSNPMQPTLLKSYSLTNPHGLSKDGSLLFVCDANGGLKIYDSVDPVNLQLVKTFLGLDAYDVITTNGTAVVVASDGLYQFDYSDQKNIKEISRLSIAK